MMSMKKLNLEPMEMTFTIENADLDKLNEVLKDVNVKECPWFEIQDKHGHKARYYRESQWIPCTEKPDRRDVYRVTVQCEHVDGYPDYEVCYGEYDEESGWFLIGEPVGRIKMVAWMPIDEVEPYQPEEEAE